MAFVFRQIYCRCHVYKLGYLVLVLLCFILISRMISNESSGEE